MAYDDLAHRGIVPVIGHHQAHLLKQWLCAEQQNGPKTCYARWKIIIAMEWDGPNMALMESVVGLLESLDECLVTFQRVFPVRDWKLVQSMEQWEDVQRELV